jgi:hypothetical protein
VTGRWLALRGLVAGPPRDPFLYQLRLLRTPLFGVYLHCILRPDEPDPHDHPWAFASLVLDGEYTERVYPDKRDSGRWTFRPRRRFSAARVPLAAAHRITVTSGPVWTLVLTGPERNRDWGFYPGGQFVPWHEYQGRQA